VLWWRKERVHTCKSAAKQWLALGCFLPFHESCSRHVHLPAQPYLQQAIAVSQEVRKCIHTTSRMGPNATKLSSHGPLRSGRPMYSCTPSVHSCDISDLAGSPPLERSCAQCVFLSAKGAERQVHAIFALLVDTCGYTEVHFDEVRLLFGILKTVYGIAKYIDRRKSMRQNSERLTSPRKRHASL
jgi:hypothetical protein